MRAVRAVPAGLAAVLASVAVLLAGCTGVPSESAPQVIASEGLQAVEQPDTGPQRGADVRAIVLGFLDANSGNDLNHASARRYLTPSESTRWSDARVTVLDTAHVGAPGKDGTVVVDGAKLGTIDASGVYSPVLTGDGGGQGSFRAQFHLTKVRGEWRIDKLPPGLLIDSSQFVDRFTQRPIYFFDSAEQHLVPDYRYTQLLDPASLATWLTQTLAAGPNDAISSGGVFTELPNQTDPSRVTVSGVGDASKPVTIGVPGASQLDGPTPVKLAIQLAATLEQVAGIASTRPLRIVDGGQTVQLSGYGATFIADDFAEQIDPATADPRLYYLSNGGVVNELGQPLRGAIGNGGYGLTSLAIASGRGTRGLLVAGTRGPAGAQNLDLGAEDDGLEAVPKLSGTLSRPAWSPIADEVWIGAGTSLYRVTTDRQVSKVAMTTPGGPATGAVTAVRFSPEGSRVALVLATRDEEQREVGHVWVGVVSREGGKVQVVGLTEISPIAVSFNDVAWNDDAKLFGVGHDNLTGKPGIYELQCDGSRFSARGLGVLPTEPANITIAPGQVAAVEAAPYVWRQLAGTWEGPTGVDTFGSSPIYTV